MKCVHKVDKRDLKIDFVSDSYTIMTVALVEDVLHAATSSDRNFPLGSFLELTLGIFFVLCATLSI